MSIGDLQAPSSLISILGIILIAVFMGRNVKGGIFLAVIIAVGCWVLLWNYKVAVDDIFYATIVGTDLVSL